MPDTNTKAIDTAIDTAATLAESPDSGSGKERREARRQAYTAKVELFLMTERTGVSQSLIVQAKDLSGTGLSVVSRQMINPGREGVARLTRSDGKIVVIGVRVVRCNYSGGMNHETGLQFIPIPPAMVRTKDGSGLPRVTEPGSTEHEGQAGEPAPEAPAPAPG